MPHGQTLAFFKTLSETRKKLRYRHSSSRSSLYQSKPSELGPYWYNDPKHASTIQKTFKSQIASKVQEEKNRCFSTWSPFTQSIFKDEFNRCLYRVQDFKDRFSNLKEKQILAISRNYQIQRLFDDEDLYLFDRL